VSDRYGRRPVLLSGLCLFLLGSVLSAVAVALLLPFTPAAHKLGFVPLPWIFVVALFVNGKIRSGPDEYYPTTVISRFNMKGIVRGSQRLLVHSWRDGQRVERLAVDADDFNRFHDGDAVVVRVQPGALGIPWVYGVFRHGTD